jgi:manganese oxidase
MNQRLQQLLSRRGFLGLSVGGAASVLGASLLGRAVQAQEATPVPTAMPSMDHAGDTTGHSMMSQMLVGSVDHERNGFDPMQMLVDWYYGTITSETEDGRPIREFDISGGDIEIEIAPGIFFPAWAYNGRVPGPTIRCAKDDHLRINFANFGSHPHTVSTLRRWMA